MHERAKVVRSPQTQELYLTGHFFDITDQKVKESEYRNLVNALENAVNGVAFINANGYHTQVNEAYADIMEGTPQELQYKSFFDLLSDKDQVNIRTLLGNFLDQKREVLTVEARSLSGNNLFLSLVLVPAYSDGAHKMSIGFYVFAKDISSDIRHENQLSEAVKAAEAANQSKSTFLATMSHELRTPLNAIIGYSDMLIEDALNAQNDMLVGDLKKINGSGRHLLSLINDILDVSKLEAGKMTVHLEVFDIMEKITTRSP
jgi:PAS domain S-box-containing protein